MSPDNFGQRTEGRDTQDGKRDLARYDLGKIIMKATMDNKDLDSLGSSGAWGA